jgi:hypothetical protein
MHTGEGGARGGGREATCGGGTYGWECSQVAGHGHFISTPCTLGGGVRAPVGESVGCEATCVGAGGGGTAHPVGVWGQVAGHQYCASPQCALVGRVGGPVGCEATCREGAGRRGGGRGAHQGWTWRWRACCWAWTLYQSSMHMSRPTWSLTCHDTAPLLLLLPAAAGCVRAHCCGVCL